MAARGKLTGNDRSYCLVVINDQNALWQHGGRVWQARERYRSAKAAMSVYRFER